jgi:two-component system sensor histidine kinase DegS
LRYVAEVVFSMNDKFSTLEGLVTQATSVLEETEANLDQLAQEALSKYQELLSNSENGRDGDDELDETTLRLQQIGQQLAKLSQRSNALQNYLKNGLDTPPADDDDWPRTKILQSQEEERTQLARELEDSVGQLLANAVFELASCRQLLVHDKTAVSEGLDALQQELEQGLADIRYFITDLEPASILNNFGLGGGVRRYLEQFEARTGLRTQLLINTNLGRLPALIEIAIFRIIQESLQNVHRHANASQVDVIFEEKEDAFEFSVIDDGDGVASDRVDMSRKNLGLARMVDYAELVQGKLRVFSEPGLGTQVILSIPHGTL